MSTQRIQLRRGNFTDLPNSGMLPGEPHLTLDRGTLHFATDATTKLPVVPAVDALTTLAAIDVADLLLLVHDASESSGQKEKKITFADFKDALNIPAGSSDEKDPGESDRDQRARPAPARERSLSE